MSEPAPRPYIIALHPVGWPVLVVGGGAVTARKVAALLESGARVTVVAPQVSEPIALLHEAGEITLKQRPFQEADLADMRLAIVATDAPDVNEKAAAAAKARGILLNDATNQDRSDWSNLARRSLGPYELAVGSRGRSPRQARAVAAALHAIAEGTGTVDALQELLDRPPRRSS